jgi:hypothetical protein
MIRRQPFLSAALFLTALFISSSARADTDTDRTIFGNASCGTFSCSRYTGLDGSSPDLINLVASANTCVANRLGYHGGDAFDVAYGLDSSNCLHPNPVPKAKQGFTISPSCCLVQTSGDNCQLACQSIGTK